VHESRPCPHSPHTPAWLSPAVRSTVSWKPKLGTRFMAGLPTLLVINILSLAHDWLAVAVGALPRTRPRLLKMATPTGHDLPSISCTGGPWSEFRSSCFALRWKLCKCRRGVGPSRWLQATADYSSPREMQPVVNCRGQIFCWASFADFCIIFSFFLDLQARYTGSNKMTCAQLMRACWSKRDAQF
jgi:hypothetical protein